MDREEYRGGGGRVPAGLARVRETRSGRLEIR